MADRFVTTTIYLAGAVANSGSVTVPYPSGYTMASFTGDQAGTDSYVVVQDNDRYTVASGLISVLYGQAAIVLFNSTGASWAAGAKVVLKLSQRASRTREELAALPLAPTKHANVWAVLGDSLAAALTVDTTLKQNSAATSPINWANSLSGGRAKYCALNNGNFGVSGERTEQIMARVPAVVSTNAGLVFIFAGTNDIGQNYPTAATCAERCASNIENMVRAILAGGARHVVVILPLGSTGWTAAQYTILYDLHQRLKEMVERIPSVYLFDPAPAVLNAANSTTAIAAKTNYFYDATHPNGRGAYYWGKALASDVVTPLVAPYPRISHLNATDVQAAAFINNGLFWTQTGGTNSIGAALTSGAVPGGFTLLRSGSATVAITYGTDDGTALDPSMGSKVILTITFTAAGEYVRLQQDVSTTGISPGDAFDAGCRARVTSGMDNLTAAKMHMSVSVDGVTRDWYSLLEGAAAQYGPDEAYQVDHRITPRLEAGSVVNFVSVRHFATARAAGTVVLELSRFGLRKRIAA